MFRLALAIAVLSCSASTVLADPEADIGEFMKRPSYRAAYEAMVTGHEGLPKWMATPQAVSDATTLKITKRLADGQDQSVFDLCKPDECDTTGLILIFSADGKQAKGLLLDKADLFLGQPDDDDRKFLLQVKSKD